jgi:hypothetical protein
LVGDPVKWEYVVVNTGDVPLTNVTLTDMQSGVTITFPTPLAPRESRSFTAEGTATEGQYSNLGTVIGTAPDGTIVSDEDLSHYFGKSRRQACCLEGIGCLDLAPDDCKSRNGEPQGEGTTCADNPNPCGPQEPQACCGVEEKCEDMLWIDCVTSGGSPQGFGKQCNDIRCMEYTACCLPDIGCVNLPQEICLQYGGDPVQGTDCSKNPCDEL